MAYPDLLLDISNNHYYLHPVANQGHTYIILFPTKDAMQSVLFLLTHFELMLFFSIP